MKSEEFEQYKNNILAKIAHVNQEDVDRELLGGLFGEMMDYMNASFHTLEKKIDHAVKARWNYGISTGIMDEREFELQKDNIFPIVPEDLKTPTISESELKKCLKKGKPFKLFSIFLEAEYKDTVDFRKKERKFECKIISDEWNYSGHCIVVQRLDYLDELEKVYKIFQRNGERFQYPCIPYLYRFFDVYLTDADFYDVEKINEIQIDWEEFSKHVKYHYFPVWNIARKRFVADVRPVPCKQLTQYCHTINKNRLNKKCSYLVAEDQIAIYDMSFQDDLCIYVPVKKKKEWNVLEFHAYDKIDSKYRFFFAIDVERTYCITTYSDIYSYIHRLGYGNDMVLKQVEMKAAADYPNITYDMNAYIAEKLPQEQNRKQIWLYFEKKDGEHFYDIDILSYLVSMLQNECKQYECVGQFL